MYALTVESVSKRFGVLVALRDVTVSIRGRERLGLIGPNGAGKTTLFNVITGFLRSDSGSVKLFGEDITGLQLTK